MDLEKPAGPPAAAPAGEGCLVVAIRIPVRIVALVVVVPVRMAWDALVVAGRFLNDTLLRPLGRALLWVGRAVFVWPFVGLWRYVLVPSGKGLVWLGKVLLVLPAIAFYRHVLTPLGHGATWLYARVLTPIGAGAWAGAVWLGRYLVVVPALWLYRWVLTPVGRAIAWGGKGLVWLGATVVTGVGTGLYWITRILLVLPALAVWRWVLVPVGRVLAVVAREVGDALGHAWRVAGHISLAVGRFLGRLFRWVFVEPVRWVYRSVLTPVGHVVRDTVLRPVGDAARAVGRATRQALAAARASVRQARADFRRTLLGEPAAEPKEPQLTHRREPVAPVTRTLEKRTE
ncbi:MULTISPECIES: hypothetical protein [unclassified Streptomyces]|uniref:hypothetical protein n=1 Tax=unclassified Streptomyces TaxID=2593676 RepID=UPI00093A4D09|nr:hypothetical protein [Streptomyces sp. CB02400]OKK12634.1 hypothetical protein AMK33_07120 [Streptomyces sp. CB02400]